MKSMECAFDPSGTFTIAHLSSPCIGRPTKVQRRPTTVQGYEAWARVTISWVVAILLDIVIRDLLIGRLAWKCSVRARFLGLDAIAKMNNDCPTSIVGNWSAGFLTISQFAGLFPYMVI